MLTAVVLLLDQGMCISRALAQVAYAPHRHNRSRYLAALPPPAARSSVIRRRRRPPPPSGRIPTELGLLTVFAGEFELASNLLTSR